VTPRCTRRAFIPQILASTTNAQDIPAAQEETRTLLRESHKVADGFALNHRLPYVTPPA
jgi:hypothetical protein